MSDLFDHAMQERMKSEAPLAARMRPRTLEEYIGQEHIVGEGKLLRRAIEADRLFSSIILWGPPGTGKTTLAQVIANTTKSHFVTIVDEFDSFAKRFDFGFSFCTHYTISPTSRHRKNC